jgi:hypothetical protein
MANPSADNWMSGLGIDIPQLRAGSTASASDDNGQSLQEDDNGQSLAPPDPATLALQQKIRSARSEAEGAVARYDAQKETEGTGPVQWAVGRVSNLTEHAVDFVSRNVVGTDGAAFADPGDSVWDGTSAAQDTADSAQAAIDAGDTDTAAAYADQAGDAASNASRLADRYQSGVIEGAEGAEDGFTAIKVSAEATDAVLATAVTGGAAAPAVAGGSATAANIVALTQGVGEAVGAQVTKRAYGDTVDWGSLSVDVLIQALMAKFGGELTEKLASSLAQRLASKYTPELLNKYLSAIVARVAMQDASAELKAAAQAAIDALTGQAVRMADLESKLLDNLTDPKSAFVAVVAGIADAKLGSFPDATGDAVLLDGTGGAADGAAAGDLLDATADAVPLDAPGDEAGADSADLPDATADAVSIDTSGSALPPPTVAPSSAKDAVNAALSQMTDDDILESVNNWKTGETPDQSNATAASDDGDSDPDAAGGASREKTDTPA